MAGRWTMLTAKQSRGCDRSTMGGNVVDFAAPQRSLIPDRPLLVCWMRRRLVANLAVLILVGTGPALGTPMSIRSAAGYFTVRLTGIGRTEPLNHMHGFDLWLTSKGKPVDGATIVLTGSRRETDNPLPTLPQISFTGTPGRYRGEGLRFHMPGNWQLTFTIASGTIRDRAIVDVAVGYQ